MAGLLLVEEAGGHAAPFPGPRGLAVKAPVVAAAPGIAAALTAIVAAAVRPA
jgi:fructose-1,6-bisphosphatase/inositol monophosphatase family enzyme